MNRTPGLLDFPELRPHWDAVFDLLADGRPAPALSPILDVGCGDGSALAAVLAGTGVRGVALDRIVAPRWNGPAGFVRVQGDAATLPFRAETFRACLHMETLEWLRDPAAALRAAARVTAGPLVIVHTDWDSLWFDSGDPDTSREFTRLFAESGPEGSVGSRLAQIVQAAGLPVAAQCRHAIRGDQFTLTTYAQHLVGLLRAWLVSRRGSVRARRFDAWRNDLAARAAAGAFAFSLTRRVVVVRCPL